MLKKLLAIKNYKFIIGLVIGLVIFGTAAYAATYIATSNQVSYSNINSELVATNVQSALDELYTKFNSNRDCASGYSKYEYQTGGYKCVKTILLSSVFSSAAMDNISSTYVTSSTGIDFSAISSDTNGKGLYIRNDTQSNTYPIYYYRGEVANNNVIFAGFCWKIIRTTATGGTKLIYNGIPSSGRCSISNDSSTQISTSPYSTILNSIDYVGYMYPSTNENNSTIKTVIDTWYANNMTSYTDKLEDTPFCNDRGVHGNTSGGTHTLFNSYVRTTDTHIPVLDCANSNDSFTVSTENGNGKLTYPVGLLTIDEAVLAGGCYGTSNTTYYLNNGQIYWTMTPAFFQYSDGNSYMIAVADTLPTYNVNPMYWSHPYLGVRPVISLKKTAVITSGNGTITKPYIVQ